MHNYYDKFVTFDERAILDEDMAEQLNQQLNNVVSPNEYYGSRKRSEFDDRFNGQCTWHYNLSKEKAMKKDSWWKRFWNKFTRTKEFESLQKELKDTQAQFKKTNHCNLYGHQFEVRLLGPLEIRAVCLRCGHKKDIANHEGVRLAAELLSREAIK